MKIDIPNKKRLLITEEYGDCSRYYYVPVVKNFYLERIKMVCKLMDRKGGRVLDLGCGSGVLFYELNKKFSHLNGMDLRSDANLVKKTLKAEGIEANLTNGNLFRLPYKDNSFDCITAMSVLEHIADLEQPLKEIKRVLKKDGYFICGFPTKNILLHLFFKLIKFDDEKDHPSSHQRIYKMIKEEFTLEKTIKFPSFLQMDCCLYVACRCKRNDI